MRKIEQAMVEALKNGKAFTRDNTTVVWGTDPTNDESEGHVYLHGNLIAKYWPDASELYLTDAGWTTVTTKSRLNAILEGLGVRWRIHQNCQGCKTKGNHLHRWYADRTNADEQTKWRGDMFFPAPTFN